MRKALKRVQIWNDPANIINYFIYVIILIYFFKKKKRVHEVHDLFPCFGIQIIYLVRIIFAVRVWSLKST